MKHARATLHVGNLLLFTSGTKDFCAVAVYVISTHLFAPSSSTAPRSPSFMISFVPGTVLDRHYA